MHEGTPLVAAEQRDLVFHNGFRRQQVDDKIKARPPRKPENGSEAQNNRLEMGVRHLFKNPLGGDFTVRVQGEGVQTGIFVQNFFACAVYGTCAGEHEPLHLTAFGDLRNHARRHQVDFNRQVLIQRAGGIAHNRAQMDNGIHVLHGFHHFMHLTKIAAYQFQRGMVPHIAQWLFTEHKQVQNANLIPGFQQLGNQRGTDVARAADN